MTKILRFHSILLNNTYYRHYALRTYKHNKILHKRHTKQAPKDIHIKAT